MRELERAALLRVGPSTGGAREGVIGALTTYAEAI